MVLTRVDISASPQLYFDSEDNFQKGHAIAAGCVRSPLLSAAAAQLTPVLFRCVFASFLAAFVLRTRLSRKNVETAETVRAAGVPETKSAEQGKTEEICDNDPRYVFMT